MTRDYFICCCCQWDGCLPLHGVTLCKALDARPRKLLPKQHLGCRARSAFNCGSRPFALSEACGASWEGLGVNPLSHINSSGLVRTINRTRQITSSPHVPFKSSPLPSVLYCELGHHAGGKYFLIAKMYLASILTIN